MIFWTLGLIIAVGGIVIALMLEPPPLYRSSNLASTLEPAVLPSASPANRSRAPASVAALVAEQDLGQAADLHLGCDDTTTSAISSRIRQVRLTGKFCGQSSEQKSKTTLVENSSNGFVATVFATPDGGFTTDYISLASGTNRLVVHHQLENGTPMTQELILHKESVITK